MCVKVPRKGAAIELLGNSVWATKLLCSLRNWRKRGSIDRSRRTILVWFMSTLNSRWALQGRFKAEGVVQ